ncbi:MAG: hypothetical protein Q4C04_08550 [Clostridia bacterium]|nr:hypothetical protein [Clostridia bacterium]
MLYSVLSQASMGDTLMIAVKGMLGTFVVIALILAVIAILKRVTRKKEQK